MFSEFETSDVFCCFDMECLVLLTFILTASEGFQLHGSSTPIGAELGDSVLLHCAVETPLPLEELEVEWRRADSDALVHLFQDGEARPESQDPAYAERAHFFTEEFVRGNYSIILHNVTMQDEGVYMCKVYTHVESSNITAELYFEWLLVTGAGVIFGYAGEEVVLNCSVDSHIPPDQLEEVTWKRKDQMLVLLYGHGEIVPDASDDRYRGRVDFFTTETSKGNFSLRLKDVRTEDKGEYICEAYSGHLSANTTVVLQELGFSNLHISILVLCSIILLYTLGFTVPACLLIQRKDISPRARVVHFSRFLCTDILLGICFILWGVAEGSLQEAAACSTLNFARFFLLMKTAPYLDQLPESFKRLKTLSAPAVFTMITIVVLSVYLWTQQFFLAEQNTISIIFFSFYTGAALLFCIIAFIIGFRKIQDAISFREIQDVISFRQHQLQISFREIQDVISFRQHQLLISFRKIQDVISFRKHQLLINVLLNLSSLIVAALLMNQGSRLHPVWLFLTVTASVVDIFCVLLQFLCLKRIRHGHVLWITLVVTLLIFKSVVILYPISVALENSEGMC